MGFSTYKMHSFYEKRTKRDEIFYFFLKFSYGLKKTPLNVGFPLFTRVPNQQKKKEKENDSLVCTACGCAVYQRFVEEKNVFFLRRGDYCEYVYGHEDRKKKEHSKHSKNA